MLRRGSAVLPAAIAAAVLLAYVVLWLGAGAAQIGRSDFTSTYVGATLLREGQGGSMYDETLQAPLHAALIAPDREGNLPFVNAPLAAAVALPVSLLSLQAAYRLWSLLQLALLVGAVVVAIRAAPGRRSLPPLTLVAVGLGALACLGTLATLLLGQWDGLSALGLAVAYACPVSYTHLTLERLAGLPLIPLPASASDQYLLHERDLGAAVLRLATLPELPRRPLVLAHPAPVGMKDLVTELARRRGSRPVIVPVPWAPAYVLLRLGEVSHLDLPVRADSLWGLSLIHI